MYDSWQKPRFCRSLLMPSFQCGTWLSNVARIHFHQMFWLEERLWTTFESALNSHDTENAHVKRKGIPRSATTRKSYHYSTGTEQAFQVLREGNKGPFRSKYLACVNIRVYRRSVEGLQVFSRLRAYYFTPVCDKGENPWIDGDEMSTTFCQDTPFQLSTHQFRFIEQQA